MTFDTHQILDLAWKTSLQAGLFAAVVWLIVRCAKNTSARLRYGLWVLVLIKFFIPPVVEIPSDMAFWQRPGAVQPAVTGQVPGTAVSAPSSEAVCVASALDTTEGQPPAVFSLDGPQTRVALDYGRLLLAVWVVGALIMLALLLLRVRRQGEFLRNCDDAGDRVKTLLAGAARSLGVRHIPAVKISRVACVPTLVGLWRPAIVLPTPVSGSCSESETEAMLLHELAHIKRRDMLVLWFYELTRVLFFFHPAVWLAGRELAIERELACDELVLASRSIAREDYAAGYVRALRMAASAARTPVSVAMAEPFEIEKRRLHMILRHDLPRSTKRWLVVVAIVAAVGLPTFAGVAQNDSKTASAGSYKQAAHTESKATEAPAEQLQPRVEQESGSVAPPQAEPAAKSAVPAPGDKAIADRSSVVTGQAEGVDTLICSKRSIIDTTLPAGIPVMAIMDGTVTEVRLVDGRGYVVTIDHGDDLVLSLEYCSSVVVKVGDHVRRGQPVAYAGYKAKAVDGSVIQPAWLQPITLPADVRVQSESGKVSLPCEGRVTSPFGYRTHPVTKVSKLHTGIDIAASTGTPIKAVADGEVITSGWMGAYGNAIIIDHGHGVSTLYAHSSKLAVQKGQKVHRGDVIAYVGATGYATGPRCHFEKRVNGVPVDPLKE